ncbi:hypothetical protein PITCH_A1070007 [uncultured Desulfobacterium sp.]|uniref:Uncharacterized protein n=1 Tax=uncultured Desulfobacterium sp. TaxID=201089 RepID=A0A445MQU7_9BACT|nr:hypothetical protein PITCH_A1070007 [uncultured Desulfobacterium sp.]
MKIGKIEKDRPIPEVNSRIKYPWSNMDVGDSVFFRVEKGESIQQLKRKVVPSSRYYGEKTNKEFKTMTERDPEEGIRVWRVR